MNNLNKIGKIKTIALGVLALPNLFLAQKQMPNQDYTVFIVPLIFGAFAIPFLSKINVKIAGREIAKPTWNDNPFNFKRPLSFFQFGSYFFFIAGLSMIIGTAIRFHEFNSFGFMNISFGLGIFIGIWITVKWLIKSR